MLTLPPGRFLILGHRGASAHAIENTPAAFRRAAELGADGVELDVRRTADDELVVYHDPAVEGAGVIHGLTLRELRTAAPHVATLDEAMDACSGLIVNIEIKNSPNEPDFDPTDRVASAIVDWIAEHGWADRVLVSSFNPATVDRVRRLSANIATGQLTDPGADVTRQLTAAHHRGHQALHPHFSSLLQEPEELVRIASGLGMWVLTWTINDPDTIRNLRNNGVTGAITDDPAVARGAIEPPP
jgi:glycerophosphoryl diester phosphodiesterase